MFHLIKIYLFILPISLSFLRVFHWIIWNLINPFEENRFIPFYFEVRYFYGLFFTFTQPTFCISLFHLTKTPLFFLKIHFFIFPILLFVLKTPLFFLRIPLFFLRAFHWIIRVFYWILCNFINPFEESPLIFPMNSNVFVFIREDFHFGIIVILVILSY